MEALEYKTRSIEVANELSKAEGELTNLRDLNEILAALPNLPAADVPDGEDEAGNVELPPWGTPCDFAFPPREPADFAPALGLDFETAAKMSGPRFSFLTGKREGQSGRAACGEEVM